MCINFTRWLLSRASPQFPADAVCEDWEPDLELVICLFRIFRRRTCPARLEKLEPVQCAARRRCLTLRSAPVTSLVRSNRPRWNPYRIGCQLETLKRCERRHQPVWGALTLEEASVTFPADLFPGI